MVVEDLRQPPAFPLLDLAEFRRQRAQPHRKPAGLLGPLGHAALQRVVQGHEVGFETFPFDGVSDRAHQRRPVEPLVLEQKSCAPLRTASVASASSLRPVSTMIGRRAPSAVACSTVARPRLSGSERSSRTASNRRPGDAGPPRPCARRASPRSARRHAQGDPAATARTGRCPRPAGRESARLHQVILRGKRPDSAGATVRRALPLPLLPLLLVHQLVRAANQLVERDRRLGVYRVSPTLSDKGHPLPPAFRLSISMRSRSTRCAAARLSVWIIRTTNSSPPMRATISESRKSPAGYARRRG